MSDGCRGVRQSLSYLPRIASTRFYTRTILTSSLHWVKTAYKIGKGAERVEAVKATVVCKLDTHLSATPTGASLRIYAPSLRSLPESSMLVMATLPVIDWNDCLLRDLRIIHKTVSTHVYAAIVMIDPFACWEDLADLMKDAGISGVVNFPPASIIERPTAGKPLNTGLELELRRMEWFASLGFKMLFAAAGDSEIIAAERRLASHLNGIVYLRQEALALRIRDEMELVSLAQQRSSIPKFSLLDTTASMRPVRKK